MLNGDAATSTHSYGLFGEVSGNASISPLSNPLVYAFAGMPLDLESGQYQTLYRQYNPTVGRWLSQDPIGFDAGDSNYYRYVFNSALGKT